MKNAIIAKLVMLALFALQESLAQDSTFVIKSTRTVSYQLDDDGKEQSREETLSSDFHTMEQFSREGLLVATEIYARQPYGYHKSTRVLNSDGTIALGMNQDENGVLRYYWLNHYNEKGQLDTIRTYRSDSTLKELEVRKYDQVGNMVRKTVDKIRSPNSLPFGWLRHSDNAFIYDSSGNVIERIQYVSAIENEQVRELLEQGNEQPRKGTSYYEYDTYGNKILEKFVRPRVDPFPRLISYEFDEHGNWITKKIRINGVLRRISERDIVYWERKL